MPESVTPTPPATDFSPSGTPTSLGAWFPFQNESTMENTTLTKTKPADQSVAIRGFKTNCMGTIDFSAQFTSMRTNQDFIIYPKPADDVALTVKIQSDTRIGRIDLQTGAVTLSKPIASGANNQHLHNAAPSGVLNAEQLLLLKASIAATSSPKAGTNGMITCDNSGSMRVMGS
jgi:hypothetical protein